MDACFEEVDTTLSIDLHPAKLRNIAGSVREELDRLLLTYRHELPGVVLSYQGHRIQTRRPLVHSFFPFFHVDAVAKLCVLRLEAGQHLGEPLMRAPAQGCRLLTALPSHPRNRNTRRQHITAQASACAPHDAAKPASCSPLCLCVSNTCRRHRARVLLQLLDPNNPDRHHVPGSAVGKVQKVGGDFLGLLVLGAFNAAIYKADMAGTFKFDGLVRRPRAAARSRAHLVARVRAGGCQAAGQSTLAPGSRLRAAYRQRSPGTRTGGCSMRSLCSACRGPCGMQLSEQAHDAACCRTCMAALPRCTCGACEEPQHLLLLHLQSAAA
jgi:hypothetical protein